LRGNGLWLLSLGGQPRRDTHRQKNDPEGHTTDRTHVEFTSEVLKP
jgi:hypothetical protein